MYTLTELGEVLHEEHFRILVPICGLENRITGRRASEPRRFCRRLQTLRGWSHGNEEDLSEILT